MIDLSSGTTLVGLITPSSTAFSNKLLSTNNLAMPSAEASPGSCPAVNVAFSSNNHIMTFLFVLVL